MVMNVEHRSKFAALQRQWWCFHMSEELSSVTINSKQIKQTNKQTNKVHTFLNSFSYFYLLSYSVHNVVPCIQDDNPDRFPLWCDRDPPDSSEDTIRNSSLRNNVSGNLIIPNILLLYTINGFVWSFFKWKIQTICTIDNGIICANFKLLKDLCNYSECSRLTINACAYRDNSGEHYSHAKIDVHIP